MITRETPTLAVLVKRLADHGIAYTGDAAGLAASIQRHALEGAICAGAIVNGKWRALRFEDYYEQVFQVGLDGKAVKQRKKA